MKRFHKIRFYACLIYVSGCLMITAGCYVPASMSSPRESERKVLAEYKLAAAKPNKILILVNKPSYVPVNADIAMYLTEAIRQNLDAKADIPMQKTVPYRQVLEYRAERNLAEMTPAQLAAAAGADHVMLVDVEDYEMTNVAGMGFYRGSLTVRCFLFDSTGKQVWPASNTGRQISVGFDTEGDKFEAAVIKLSGAAAHCIARSFKDTPKYKYGIFEEKKSIDSDAF